MRSQEFMELRAFELVAHKLSFSRAAEEIGMSRAALSALVRNFEQRLGLQLLTRTTRSVALTDAGQQLLDRLSPALRQLVTAVEHIDQFRERPRGRITLSTCPLGAELYIKPMHPAFRQAQPEVTLDIHVDHGASDDHIHGFDAAVRPEGCIDKDLVAIQVAAQSEFIFVASQNYIQQHGCPVTLADLSDHQWIDIKAYTGLAGHRLVDLRKFALPAENGTSVNDFRLGLELVNADAGFALIPRSVFLDRERDGTLQHIIPEVSFPLPAFYLCYPRHTQSTLAFRAFVEFNKDRGPVAQEFA
jgi:DNA-binding transcriptional LysR family regulator